MTPLSQRDARWSNTKLGTGSLTIGQAGCTITCVAMLAGTTPDVVNSKLKAVGGYANTNLIIWQKIHEAIPHLSWLDRGYTYENTKVADAIKSYGACLVEVNGAPIGGTKHWVLYIGNKELIDPWDGKIKPTSSYQAIGYSVIQVSSTSEPMLDALQECLSQHRDLINQLETEKKAHDLTKIDRDAYKTRMDEAIKKYDSFVGWVVDKLKPSGVLPSVADEAYAKQLIEGIITSESALQSELKTKEKEWALEKKELLAEQKNLIDRISQLDDALLQSQATIANLSDELTILKKDVEQHKEHVDEVKELKTFLDLLKALFRRNK